VSLENGDLKTKFIGGKLFEVDMTLSLYQEEKGD